MPAITIRNVPQGTRDELAARASLRGLSLQEYLRSELIGLARQVDQEELLERIRTRVANNDSSIESQSIIDDIRTWRDR
jgi:hypothetical protein